MKKTITFSCTGSDSIAQFGIWLIVLGAGCIPFPIYIYRWGGIAALVISVITMCVVLIGLRTTITVTSSRVTIVKKCFFIPYRWYSATAIKDVRFNGDWGDPEGASGIVITLGKKEICIGSNKTMHQLYNALDPLCALI